MFPSTKKQPETGVIAHIKRLCPEILLTTTTLCYFMLSCFIFEKNLLIFYPVTTTLVFVSFHSVIEFIVFRYMWSWCKPAEPGFNFKFKSKTKMHQWVKGFMMFATCWLTSHIICVLFGAPLLSMVMETTSWASLVAVLITIPGLCMFGVDVEKWYQVIVCGEYKSQDERFIYIQTLGVVLGSWASAIVIPLDWDRPWQTWPIPCVVGCITGYLCAVMVSCVLTVKEMKTAKIQ
ncbi:unnamed protein product [Clavelina lepadiformis]|uniref:Phosphatidylinositol-glycan biosynthesis class F protein n=1 Tax=Clavelina lepadiformis TaxID=159417 RepID=A0ABP0G6G8_CLALP